MKHQTPKRTPAISPSRWAAYATAGAASALAAATTAEADIHYSGPVNQIVPAQESVTHTFNLDNGAMLQFLNAAVTNGSSSPVPGYGIALFRLRGAAVSNQFEGIAVTNFRYPDKLASDFNLSGGAFANFNGALFATLAFGKGYANSKFKAAGVGFIGFRFNGGAGVEYGWARVNMQGATGNGFTIVDYAWADPGTPIRTGQTSAAIPEPSSIGLLAAGAAGLALWRRRRAQKS